MIMVLDIAGIFMYLFSFFPSPIAEMVMALFALCVFMLVLRFISLIKNMIPFL